MPFRARLLSGMGGAVWFKCRGCGEPAGYYPEGHRVDGCAVPPGAVMHSKPRADVNRRPVVCALYQRLEPGEFWAVHKDDPPIEGPSQIRPAQPGVVVIVG